MTENIDERHLPSVKFEELKSRIGYDTVNNFVKNITTDEQISTWIATFKTITEEYFNNLSQQPSRTRYNCSSFYYLTNGILEKIQSLREHPFDTHILRQRIKDIRDKYYGYSPDLTCNRKYTYLKYEKKILDDFCEDIIFINENISAIKMSDNCQRIIDNISSRRVTLIGMKDFFERGGKTTVITDTCNNKILNKTFPFFACTPRDKQADQHSAVLGSGHHADGQQLGKGSGDQSFSPSGKLTIDGQESFISPEGETNNVSPINEIISVSLPILGVSVFSFLLYNFTSFGSKIQTFLKKKNDISINQDDNLTNPLSLDASNYEDIYSDNMQYNISYHNV
ncbi:PIR Superfamily Protein [Plasmodium ovale curtisi]|uniref:PIR Superfamily Protein n=1 Tax=Plasmodium ovale curtisi TaxID=864141 RepID=A0A1A8WDH9_PLAOA|nr:PIR Superfamily Protein [Plasmodium ovale curtisi]